MSEKTVQARLESLTQKIEDIAFIVERHGGIVAALNDREGQPAILMLIEAIAEQIAKLEKQDAADQTGFSPETLRGIKATRNVIAHDYDGIDLALIELGVRDLLRRR
ncbi:MAG: DUF86 domain-containing protein [Campylobacterales bacterium]